MKARSAKKVFLDRLVAAGKSVDDLTPAEGVEAMLAFYAEERADGCDFDEDGDMLLFQWMADEEPDEEPSVEIDITRQLTEDDGEEPRQLSLTFKFNSTSAPGKIGVGQKWCESTRKLPAFRKFISSHRAMKALGAETPVEVELNFGRT
jgi:hypothetical protein